ncbi:hypothetical protein RUND412_001102 [Rhizina undulata]
MDNIKQSLTAENTETLSVKSLRQLQGLSEYQATSDDAESSKVITGDLRTIEERGRLLHEAKVLAANGFRYHFQLSGYNGPTPPQSLKRKTPASTTIQATFDNAESSKVIASDLGTIEDSGRLLRTAKAYAANGFRYVFQLSGYNGPKPPQYQEFKTPAPTTIDGLSRIRCKTPITPTSRIPETANYQIGDKLCSGTEISHPGRM